MHTLIPSAPLGSPAASLPVSKSVRKSEKTPSKTPLRDGVNGGKLLTGNPGNKGGTGRPPDWLKLWCDDLLANPKCKQQVEDILEDKKHPAFSTMWSKVADRAHGRPKETLSVEVSLKPFERMARARARVANDRADR